MSEHNEQQPLTRRERREREMGETGALDLSEVVEASSGEVSENTLAAAAETVVDAGEGDDIEISPFNEDGSPRGRREVRQLREEALAAREAARAAAMPDTVESDPAAVEAEPEPAVEAEPEVAVEAEPEVAVEGEPEAAAEAEPVAEPIPDDHPEPVAADSQTGVTPDFDSLIAPPTEPFTVADLHEASQPSEHSVLFDEPASEEAPEPVAEAPLEAVSEEEPASSEEQAVPSKPKRRFPWNRNKEAEAAVPPVAVDPAPADESVDDLSARISVSEDTSTVAGEVIEDLSEAAEAEIEPEIEAEPEAEPDLEPAEAPETRANSETPGYSFPDIVPPEEWRSVFDDPSSRAAVSDSPDSPNAPATPNGGDFDDLISRAVAQEGAAGTSNTSALILPSMPEDTGGLSGPLGSTGEFYLTGSIELPKSMGETGGHSALLDSVEMDPFVAHEISEPQVTSEAGPAPVSARRAVSARVSSGIPVVAKPTKEHSKLPLVLSLTGGGLLAAVIAYVAWAASQGMFG